MKKLLGLAAGLLLGASAVYADGQNCSDAYGMLRMSRLKTEESKEPVWFYEGTPYEDKYVDASVKEKKATKLLGDEYNGVFATWAKFKLHELKIKNRRVICQNVHEEKSKVLPDETPPNYVAWNFEPMLHCSNAFGTIRRVGNAHFSTWYVNSVPVRPGTVAVVNLNRIFDLKDGAVVYEVVLRYDDGLEEVPTFVLCQF